MRWAGVLGSNGDWGGRSVGGGDGDVGVVFAAVGAARWQCCRVGR